MNNTKRKKEQRQSLYVTVVVILMMVTVVVAIATSLARNPGTVEDSDPVLNEEESFSGLEGEGDIPDAEDVFLGEDDENEDEDSEAGDKSDAGTDDKKTDSDTQAAPGVQEKIPELIAPVKGGVLRECSIDVPVYSVTMEDYRTHTGVDLYCSAGSDVAAAAGGKVEKVWDDPLWGTCIRIAHSGGAVTVYKNLCEDVLSGITEGVTVEAGQIIGAAGNTALLEIGEDDHIHFELYVDGTAEDPSDYIEFSSAPVYED